MDTDYLTDVVTLLFADVEKSTSGHQVYGTLFGDSIRAMHRIARGAAIEHGGCYVKNTGDGFLLDFISPMNAVLCAAQIQSTLLGADWDDTLPRLALRIGIHTGEPTMQDGDYTYPISWRAHRVMDAANGAQVLVAESTYGRISGEINQHEGLKVLTLGEFRLRDLLISERLYRLEIQGIDLSLKPPRVLIHNRHNLPLEKRPFVGREKEQGHLLELFRAGSSRLVTIVGMGGMGKTRLARQVAAQLTEMFPDGVWQVECDGLGNVQELSAAIRRDLDLPMDVSDRVIMNELSGKRCLLLLDCFEGLASSSFWLETLLSAAPHMYCLVTSRLVLRLERELTYLLQPFPKPQDTNASLLLFTNSARYVDPTFELNELNLPVVTEICDLLEGIPLSINLAAGWLRYMNVTELLETVRSRRQDVLNNGMLDNVKHRDMAEVVDQSVVLLRPEEKRQLLLFTVFVGGFYIEDACSVCLPSPQTPIQRATLRQRIACLLDNSLVHANGADTRTRYKIYDTVREYLVERSGLEASTGDEDRIELDACRDRHCGHYAGLALHIKKHFAENRYKEANDILWNEIGNFRVAVKYSIDYGQHERLIAFTEGLARSYHEAGLWEDLQVLREAAEPAARQLGRLDVITTLLGLCGSQATRRGQHEEARRMWEEQVELCIEVGNVNRAASTLIDLATMDTQADDHESARKRLSRAIELSQTGDYRAAAQALLASIAMKEDDILAARHHVLQGMQLITMIENMDVQIYVSSKLGSTCSSLGETQRADALLLNAVRIALDGSRSFALSVALLSYAQLAEKRDQQQIAACAYVAACTVLPAAESSQRYRVDDALERYRSAADHAALRQLDLLAELSGPDIVERLLRLCAERGESSELDPKDKSISDLKALR